MADRTKPLRPFVSENLVRALETFFPNKIPDGLRDMTDTQVVRAVSKVEAHQEVIDLMKEALRDLEGDLNGGMYVHC